MEPLLFRSEMPKKARDKMLFAALHLFTSKKYRETAILEVVERARVSKTTFYQFFTGKEDLLASLFAQLAEETLREVQLAIEAEERIPYKGYAGIRRYIQLCTEREAVARLLLVSSVGISPGVEEVRRQSLVRFSDLIYRTVQGAMPDHVPDASVRVVSRAMVGAVNEVVIQRMSDAADPVGTDELARLLNRIVVGAFTNLVLDRQE